MMENLSESQPIIMDIQVLERSPSRYRIRLFQEDDTIGNLLIHQIGLSKTIDFVTYQRCHYLHKPSFIDLQYQTTEPTDRIESYFFEAIEHLEKHIQNIFSLIP